MKKRLAVPIVVLAFAVPAAAQNWSLGVSTGPFVFGKFAERTLRATTNAQVLADSSSVKLTAGTRAGLAVDLERRLSDRWAVRLEASGTEAPLAVRDEGGSSVSLDAGRLDVATVMLPFVFRINPRGTFRVHLLAGPAHAFYHVRRRANANLTISPFVGTRARWGIAAGGGMSWNFSDRFAAEGQLVDIATSSPFKASDFAASSRVKIPKPHNVHTTVGVRWRF